MTAEKRRQFSITEPELIVEKTEALNGQWVTSGQARYEILRGDDYVAGNLSFPFKDAKSRDDAIAQASEQLELVLNVLTDFFQTYPVSATASKE